MMKQTIIIAVIAGLVFALAPAALADVTLYTENFVGDDDPEVISSSPVGWTASGSNVKVGTATGWSGLAPPDGDDWYMAKSGWDAYMYNVTTHEYTVNSADRQELKFLVDWAFDRNATGETPSVYFIAQVGGDWYRSSPIQKVNGSGHGSVSGYAVSEWVADGTVSEDDDWFVWQGTTYPWAQSWGPWQSRQEWTGWDVGTGAPLPAGDITGFGIQVDTANGALAFAADNFRITMVPEPATMTLLGLGGLGLLFKRRRK